MPASNALARIGVSALITPPGPAQSPWTWNLNAPGVDLGQCDGVYAYEFGDATTTITVTPSAITGSLAEIAAPVATAPADVTRAFAVSIAPVSSATTPTGSIRIRHVRPMQASADTYAGTGSTTGNLITFAGAHPFAVNEKIRFTVLAGGAGLALSTDYWVKTAPSSTTLTVSATRGGSAVAITTNYSALTAIAYESVADKTITTTLTATNPTYVFVATDGEPSSNADEILEVFRAGTTGWKVTVVYLGTAF